MRRAECRAVSALALSTLEDCATSFHVILPVAERVPWSRSVLLEVQDQVALRTLGTRRPAPVPAPCRCPLSALRRCVSASPAASTLTRETLSLVFHLSPHLFAPLPYRRPRTMPLCSRLSVTPSRLLFHALAPIRFMHRFLARPHDASYRSRLHSRRVPFIHDDCRLESRTHEFSEFQHLALDPLSFDAPARTHGLSVAPSSRPCGRASRQGGAAVPAKESLAFTHVEWRPERQQQA